MKRLVVYGRKKYDSDYAGNHWLFDRQIMSEASEFNKNFVSAEKDFLVEMDPFEVEEYKDVTLLVQSPVEYIQKKLTDYGADNEEYEEGAVDILNDIYEDLEIDLQIVREHKTLANCDEDIEFLKEHDLQEYESWRVVLRWFVDAGVLPDALEAFIYNYNSDGRKSSDFWARVVIGILHEETGHANKVEEIDLSEIYESAQDFVSDPIAHLKNLRATLPGPNTAVQALDRLSAYTGALLGETIEIENKFLKVWMTHDSQSTESISALFSMLRLSGFTKTEVQAWITTYEDELSPEMKMLENKLNVILDAIYDD